MQLDFTSWISRALDCPELWTMWALDCPEQRTMWAWTFILQNGNWDNLYPSRGQCIFFPICISTGERQISSSFQDLSFTGA